MGDGAGTQEEGDTPEGSSPEQPRDQASGIDIQRLAEKVYRLAMAETRLARARGERVGRRGGR